MTEGKFKKVRGVFELPKGSGVYGIQYFVDGRRRRERIGPFKLAVAVLEKRRTERREAKHSPKLHMRAVLFDDLLSDYRGAKDREGKAIQRGEYGYRRLLEAFGGRRAAEIEARDVEVFRDRLLTELAPASVVRHLTLLRAILNRGIRDGRLAKLPTREVEWPEENNERVRCLSDEEEARLFDVLPERLKSLVVLALNTGMRRGELLALRWKDIDLVNQTITIRMSKSGKGRRMPMSEQAYDTLSTMRRERIREVGADADLVAFRELLLFGPSSEAMKMALKRHFQEAIRAPGIEDFHFHDSRRTAASRPVMGGIDLYTVGELLGHRTLGMTKRYAHLSPDHLKRAVSLLDRRKARQSAGSADVMLTSEHRAGD
jgi:integrase